MLAHMMIISQEKELNWQFRFIILLSHYRHMLDWRHNFFAKMWASGPVQCRNIMDCARYQEKIMNLTNL